MILSILDHYYLYFTIFYAFCKELFRVKEDFFTKTLYLLDLDQIGVTALTRRITAGDDDFISLGK